MVLSKEFLLLIGLLFCFSFSKAASQTISEVEYQGKHNVLLKDLDDAIRSQGKYKDLAREENHQVQMQLTSELIELTASFLKSYGLIQTHDDSNGPGKGIVILPNSNETPDAVRTNLQILNDLGINVFLAPEVFKVKGNLAAEGSWVNLRSLQLLNDPHSLQEMIFESYKAQSSGFGRFLKGLRPFDLGREQTKKNIEDKKVRIGRIIEYLLKSTGHKYTVIHDKDGFSKYEIAAGSGVLGLIQKSYPGLSVEVSPIDGGLRSVGGSFDPASNRLVIGLSIEVLKTVKNSTLMHELLHARFTNQLHLKGRSIFSLEITNNEAPRPGRYNPYLQFMSTEEIATHAQDAYLMAKNGDTGPEVSRLAEITESSVVSIDSLLSIKTLTFSRGFTGHIPTTSLSSEKVTIKFYSFPPQNEEEARAFLLESRDKLSKIHQEVIRVMKEATARPNDTTILFRDLFQNIISYSKVAKGNPTCSGLFN